MTAPRRYRWFRFSLRTLFAVVTALCCWLGYQLHWIGERHRLLADHVIVEGFYLADIPGPPALRLFGERGYGDLLYVPDWANEGDVAAVSFLAAEVPTRPISAEALRRAASLFPESRLRTLIEAYPGRNGPCKDYFDQCRGDNPGAVNPRSRLRRPKLPLAGR